MLDARTDPRHPESEQIIEWLDDDYDPDLAEELPIKYTLGCIAAKTRIATTNRAGPGLRRIKTSPQRALHGIGR